MEKGTAKGIAALLMAAAISTSSAFGGQVFPGKIEGYPEDVAIFANKAYKPADKTTLILHLHGWLHVRDHLAGKMEKFDDVLAEFNFGELLERSGRNDAILVVPSSLGHCETYDANLMNPKSYDSFLSTLARKLKDLGLARTAELESVTLSGHSGAFVSISAMMWHRKTAAVNLLDATYGRFDDFAKFIETRPDARFRGVVVAETETHAGLRELWNAIRARKLVPAEALSSVDPTLEKKLRATNPAFVLWQADVKDAHWKTVSQFLPIFLRK
ncbi:MAG: hypothetical protein HYW49_03030 [Deltaproteobacteria bacterium]|nr:hypothetical protein [Deltaproteobacteria bacterium]